jgi:hypothetical protein
MTRWKALSKLRVLAAALIGVCAIGFAARGQGDVHDRAGGAVADGVRGVGGDAGAGLAPMRRAAMRWLSVSTA